MTTSTTTRARSNADKSAPASSRPIVSLKGKGKAARELAYLKIAPLSFVENASRADTISNLRIALGNAWTTLIAAELLAASSGLGYVALNASRTLDTDILLVAMICIGLLGAFLSFLMQGVARIAAPCREP